MSDNTENPESFGERIPGAIEATTTEVDPQYEAYILLSVEEANASIMKTPEEQAEIGALEQELQVALGGAAESGKVQTYETLNKIGFEIVRAATESQVEISPEAQRRQETIRTAESLEGRKFAFSGISERYNATLSAERAECQDYFIGTWDELTEKFKTQGIKVHTGKNGEIHILPGDSNDVENDGIMPRHLEISDDMDEGLKELIRKNQP